MEFRLLSKEEIDVRVQSNTEKGAVLLLYKDARCDMNILDETVGATRWQRRHEVVKENLFCTVSIYDETLGQWVSKQDVGVESNTEAQKGEASDSFKRACFNWGIGRELYTSPFIYIELKPSEVDTNAQRTKIKSFVKFEVSHIKYENKRIVELKVTDQNGETRFDTSKKITSNSSNGAKNETKKEVKKEAKEVIEQPNQEKTTNGNGTFKPSKYKQISELIKGSKYTIDDVMDYIKKAYKVDVPVNNLTDTQFEEMYIRLQTTINKERASVS